jgi:hypothetical protein
VSRNARIPMPRGRRMALNSGLAAGAAVIAVSISMGTAPAARADVVGSDAVSDLFGTADPAAAVSAAGVSQTLALSYLVEAFDPTSFNAAGAPIDPLGLLAYYTDTYLLGPTGLDAELAPLVQELVGTVTGGSPPVEPAAISDLVAALDPQAFTGGLSATPTDEFGILAYDLDVFLLEPSGIDGLIYPSIEEFINSLPAGAASVDVDPFIDGLLNSVTLF